MDVKVNQNEIIKSESNFLRGTLRKSLADELTGSLSPADAQISKFHGFYEQDDRDLRQDRKEHFLEPYYSFMLRARLPGGVCTPEQWLAIDSVGRTLGNGTVRLTTRQTFQFHGILKKKLKPLIQEINKVMLDSIGGCGDVNRNVLCNPNPLRSDLHSEVYEWSNKISEALLPKTRAYHEIWLDEKPVQEKTDEPLYGASYLPRKFKTAIAVPPHNDVDIYTNDLGFIGIEENGQLIGFNVVAGGGMGTTHGDTTTYPRLADDLGFIRSEDTINVAKAVLVVQRDFGNRMSRRHARLKYTVESMGIDRFRKEVEKHTGVNFEPPRFVEFVDQGDRYGWEKGTDGNSHLTLYIENGRVVDSNNASVMTGLREIAKIHQGDFRITANQNLIVANVSSDAKTDIESLAQQHGLLAKGLSKTRLDSISCVSFPTCPQAMAEAERYFPEFLEQIEAIEAKHGLQDHSTVIRMTGCPNGCARPFVAEIGLVGKAAGRYNLMLGGDGKGSRINKLYKENLAEDELLIVLDSLYEGYAAERLEAEGFGDYSVRSGLVARVEKAAEDYHA